MLWSLLFILLIGAPKCLEGACKCTNGELSCPQTGGQMCHGECECPDGTPICPEHGACRCSNGEPKCPGGVFMCPEEFPFCQPKSNWISSQSSDNGGNKAEEAVDKNKESCTKTQKDENPWWMIDLKDVYDISSIAIYNKDDKDISGAQIYIGNSTADNCPTNEPVKTITDFTKDCWNVYQTDTSGRYITVCHPKKKHLVLCEVRINAEKKEPPICLEDADFCQPKSNWISSQSSDYERRNAEKAVDKNKKSCTKTQKEENSWWMIDLKDVYDISSIAIYNNNYNKNISGAQIYIGNCPENNGLTNELVKNITDFTKGCWNVYQTNRLGRYITVYLPKNEHLVLCEVRIKGKKKEEEMQIPNADADFCQPNDNWITSQSSDYENENVKYNSTRATDGSKTVCAHTKKNENSWWMIDLKGVYDISSIAIYNNNHHNIHMEGARIHIGYSCKNNGTDNKLVKNITNSQIGCWNVYQTDTSGRYITVYLPKNEHLVLCEVRINAKRKHSPFELITQNKTWENALEYCRAKDKDLASILDEEDQAWAELEATKADTPFVWLGLHYTCVLEFWFWVADHPLGFHHWAPNNKKEECDISVAMETTEDHQWFSKHVNDKFNFLCEK